MQQEDGCKNDTGDRKMPEWLTAGAGAIGELEEPMTETEFLKQVKKTFETGCVKHTKLTGRLITKGEIKYHDYFYYEDKILAAEIGHYESEQYTKEIIQDLLNRKFPSLRTELTRINTNPIKYL